VPCVNNSFLEYFKYHSINGYWMTFTFVIILFDLQY
jgi:hypothetical protein